MTGPIRVLICDDHLLIRASLHSLVANFPGIEVVGEAGDGREALELADKLRPDVVLMDISMPSLNGVEATRCLARDHPRMRVVILSMHVDEEHVLGALRSGAAAYVFKGGAPSELEMAIRTAVRGEIFLSPAISRHVLDVFLERPASHAGPFDALTPRQREILQLVAEGRSSKEIAQLLNSSVKTVESHRASLMERLDIHDVAGLVRYAIRHGLVSPEQ